MTGTFNGGGELTLMVSAGTGYAAGEDFSSLRSELSECGCVFIIDFLFAIFRSGYAKCADFTAASSTSIVCHDFYLLSK